MTDAKTFENLEIQIGKHKIKGFEKDANINITPNIQESGMFVFKYKGLLHQLATDIDSANIDSFENAINGLLALIKLQKAGKLESTEEGYKINIVGINDKDAEIIDKMIIALFSPHRPPHSLDEGPLLATKAKLKAMENKNDK